MFSSFGNFPGLLKEMYARWVRGAAGDDEDSDEEAIDAMPNWLDPNSVKERLRSRVKHYNEGRKKRFFGVTGASKDFLKKYHKAAKDLEVWVFLFFLIATN